MGLISSAAHCDASCGGSQAKSKYQRHRTQWIPGFLKQSLGLLALARIGYRRTSGCS